MHQVGKVGIFSLPATRDPRRRNGESEGLAFGEQYSLEEFFEQNTGRHKGLAFGKAVSLERTQIISVVADCYAMA